MNAHINLGRRGEDAAVDYLVGLGWTIIDRNWRCREGELDIVAHDGRRHIVCEVKTRRSARFGDPSKRSPPTRRPGYGGWPGGGPPPTESAARPCGWTSSA